MMACFVCGHNVCRVDAIFGQAAEPKARLLSPSLAALQFAKPPASIYAAVHSMYLASELFVTFGPACSLGVPASLSELATR